MKAVEMWVAAYVLNSLWQVPLVLAAARVAARLVRPVGPRMEHRVWVGAVVVEVVLPGCQIDLGSVVRGGWAVLEALLRNGLGSGGTGEQTRIVLGPGRVLGAGLLNLPGWLLSALMVSYAAVVVYSATRLVLGLWQTRGILRRAKPLAGKATWVVEAAMGSCPEGVQVLISSAIAGPVTVGIRRRVLLLPEGFLEGVSERDLQAVLAHELVHIARRDFAKNLLYGVLTLPAGYHPALRYTMARLAETREMVCDEIAAAAVAGRDGYVRSLLRLASMLVVPMPARTIHAIGILDANSFERRVMNLTTKRREVAGVRRVVVVACVGVCLVACASALALRMDFRPAAAGASESGKRRHVGVDDVKIAHKVQPVYPLKAKQDKNTINGKVVLTVIIGKDGEPENIQVKQSLRDDYDRSALDAVRQWKWEPYLLNGDPVEVETDVSIIYEIAK